MKEHTLTIPIYDFYIKVIVSDNYEELEQAINDIDDSMSMDNGGMIVFRTGYRWYTLGVLTEAVSPGNIAHEAAHLTNRIYRDIGGELDYTNDEPFCYLLGFITDGIHKIIHDGKDS